MIILVAGTGTICVGGYSFLSFWLVEVIVSSGPFCDFISKLCIM